jgi:hypothetical protein
MSCDRFEKYGRGKITEAEFKKHLETCSHCQQLFFEDIELVSLAKSLKRPVKAPFLWTRIEQSLKEEMKGRRPIGKGFFLQKRWMPAALTVLFFLLVFSSLFFLVRPGIKGRDLLADSAIRRIERRERRYERSIRRLEEKTRPQMADLDLELLLLYQDRLETIDEQIAQCREALASNSGNAHIWRYMLAAFQDKKETFKEILKTDEPDVQEQILE